MSSDPKKPFDAAPNATPDLLQQDLSLDRRAARRVPTFTELQAAQVPPPPPPSAVAPPNLQRKAAPPSPQQFAQQRVAPPQPPAQSALRPPPPPPMSVPTPAARPPPAPAPLQLAPQAAVFRPSVHLPPAPPKPAPQPTTTMKLPAFSPQTDAAPQGTGTQKHPQFTPQSMPLDPVFSPSADAPVPAQPRPAVQPPGVSAAPSASSFATGSPGAAQPRAATQDPSFSPGAPSPMQPRAATSQPSSAMSGAAVTQPRTATSQPSSATSSPALTQQRAATSQSSSATGSAAVAQPRIPTSEPSFSLGVPAPTQPRAATQDPSFSLGAPATTQPRATTSEPSFSVGVPAATQPRAPAQDPSFSLGASAATREHTQPAPLDPSFALGVPAATQPAMPEHARAPISEAAPAVTPSFGDELSTEPAISLKAAPVATRGPHPNPLPRAGEGAAAVVRAEPAAVWRRAGAWLVDLSFIALLVGAFLFIAMSVIAPKHLTIVQQLSLLAVPGAALAGMLAFVYTTLFAFLWNGRTPGRRALGIHLVDTSGHAPGPMRALTRAGLSLVSFGLFLSGFWLALFDRHGQTLHDKLTRTFVVRLSGA